MGVNGRTEDMDRDSKIAAREHHQRECWCGINHELERRIADHGTNAPAAAPVRNEI